MATLDPLRWAVLSPYVDQALDLPEPQRLMWLNTIRQQQPDIAADLEFLLEEHRAALPRPHRTRRPAAKQSARTR
jgi:hypothetical protein